MATPAPPKPGTPADDKNGHYIRVAERHRQKTGSLLAERVLAVKPMRAAAERVTKA